MSVTILGHALLAVALVIVVAIVAWVVLNGLARRATEQATRHKRVVLVYAHRGACRELPENTLAAFARALELGVDAIETDAHLTSDGHVVLSHDPDGQRRCGIDKRIEYTTLAEVKTWDAGDGHRIPTLLEALERFPLACFNVDIKARQPDAADRAVDAVNTVGASNRVLLTSFDRPTLERVRSLGYAGRTGLAPGEVVELLLLPNYTPPGHAAQIPFQLGGFDLGARSLIERCHARGVEVHYWTVNDTKLASRLIEAGADVLITDDPRALCRPR